MNSELNTITDKIIAASIHIHKRSGSGLLESVYLKLADTKPGLLINFNEVLLKDGIRRVIND